MRSVESIMLDVQDAFDRGFRKFYMCFDCTSKDKHSYLRELFARMVDAFARRVTLLFEVYHLPARWHAW